MTKKLNILVCNAQVPLVKGGAETLAEELVIQLKKRGHSVDYINIPFKQYPNKQLLKDMFIWKLLDLTESDGKKVDLVIATKFPSYLVSHPNKRLWLVHQFRQAYDLFGTVISPFNPLVKEDLDIKNKITEWDTKFIKEYKKRYAISNNVRDRLKKYNDIDSQTLYPPPKMCSEYHCESYGDYILSVGRLDPLKRVDLLIKALKHCNKQIKCKIAGTGNELDRLKSVAKEEKVLDRIEFLGFVDDKELLKLYANAFCVFFSPQDEDYGYITIEAFLSKKPVITAKDSGGSLEFVEDNINGYVIDKNNIKEIGKRINDLFSNKKKCKEFGEKGYSKVKHINWDYTISKLLE
jgi:glycosyltransferase involved in cell wall biosynthesis